LAMILSNWCRYRVKDDGGERVNSRLRIVRIVNRESCHVTDSISESDPTPRVSQAKLLFEANFLKLE
jgi:hypothetical protein